MHLTRTQASKILKHIPFPELSLIGPVFNDGVLPEPRLH